mmetsp:Transcript_25543/g.73458  ORF Transcript_25543/g.73458 Transcript_25543/m.73458 type:complete len:323 (-) Transcript_25543:1502-2470(-)
MALRPVGGLAVAAALRAEVQADLEESLPDAGGVRGLRHTAIARRQYGRSLAVADASGDCRKWLRERGAGLRDEALRWLLLCVDALVAVVMRHLGVGQTFTGRWRFHRALELVQLEAPPQVGVVARQHRRGRLGVVKCRGLGRSAECGIRARKVVGGASGFRGLVELRAGEGCSEEGCSAGTILVAGVAMVYPGGEHTHQQLWGVGVGFHRVGEVADLDDPGLVDVLAQGVVQRLCGDLVHRWEHHVFQRVGSEGFPLVVREDLHDRRAEVPNFGAVLLREGVRRLELAHGSQNAHAQPHPSPGREHLRGHRGHCRLLGVHDG